VIGPALVSAESAGIIGDRLAGTLLGTALGDALGLPCEGMSATAIARRFGTVDRFRLLFGRTLAQVTHRDDRAVDGALFVAELAACLASSTDCALLETYVSKARGVVTNPELGPPIDRAVRLAAQGVCTAEAARVCGTTGFVVHTVAFATFCLVRFGGDPMRTLSESVSAGGDTDSIGAILGAWLGALHGTGALPGPLIARIHDGPFGPSHLRALALCLRQAREGSGPPVPRYSAMGALVRNLALYPVVLAHGFRRLVPV
jgi:ADP-ribosyl-[dinitrogen reductase] hydrolase